MVVQGDPNQEEAPHTGCPWLQKRAHCMQKHLVRLEGTGET